MKKPYFNPPIGKYGQANLDFRLSPEFVKMSDPTTIKAGSEMRQYIENRLMESFRMGVQRGEQIAADRISRLALGQSPAD